MIVHTGFLPSRAKTLVEELASTSGSPTTHSLSPYNGMNHVLREQFPDDDLAYVLSCLSSCADYNADVQKPVKGPYVKRQSVTGEYLRKLEDIDESWVRKYLVDALVGIKVNRLGGIREAARKNKVTRTFTNSEGETVEEGECLIDYADYPPLTMAEAKSKLPYLLKRLFEKSKQLGVSTMSLIIAYESAKYYTKTEPKPKDLLSYNIYQVDSEGNITTPFPASANSGKKFPPASNWIRGYDQDTYFHDAMELLNVCRVLGIDIRKEDPHDYQAADMDKLIVTYVAKNKDYLFSNRKYNQNVLESLSKVNISDYKRRTAAPPALSVRIQNTIQAVIDCENEDIRNIVRHGENWDGLEEFFKKYAEVNPGFRAKHGGVLEVPTAEDFIVQEGFLYQKNDLVQPCLFSVKRFADDSVEATALAHVSGYLFSVTDSATLHYIDVELLGAYIDDYQRGVFDGHYTGRCKYGRWYSCFA